METTLGSGPRRPVIRRRLPILELDQLGRWRRSGSLQAQLLQHSYVAWRYAAGLEASPSVRAAWETAMDAIGEELDGIPAG